MESDKYSSAIIPCALVVEDNNVLRLIAARALQKLGYSVSCAGDGMAAVTLVRKQSFALILMDVQMPVMDGLESTRQIRNIEKFTGQCATIIGVSAASSEHLCISAGMDAFLPKPLKIDSLTRCLEVKGLSAHSESGRRQIG